MWNFQLSSVALLEIIEQSWPLDRRSDNATDHLLLNFTKNQLLSCLLLPFH